MNQALIITEQINGNPIEFQARDAFVNATSMCKAFGKVPYDFLRLPTTKAFQAALAEDLKLLPENLVIVQQGGNQRVSPLRENPVTDQGTWLHPDLALKCAYWLDPAFEIKCNRVIRQILVGTYTVPGAEHILEGKERFIGMLEFLNGRGVSNETAAKIASDIFLDDRVQARFDSRKITPSAPAPTSWRNEPTSKRQRKRLEAMGLPVPLTKGEASDLYNAHKKDQPKCAKHISKKAVGRSRKYNDADILPLIPDKGITLAGLMHAAKANIGMSATTVYYAVNRLEQSGKVIKRRNNFGKLIAVERGGLL